MTEEQDNIVALRPGQLSTQRMEQLRSDGLLLPDAPAFDTLVLDASGPGETYLGELTGNEAEMFANYYDAAAQLHALQQTVSSAIYHELGNQAIADQPVDEPHLLQQAVTPEVGYALHRLWRRVEALKHLLFWQLGERFGCHEYNIGVRAGRKVVRGARKY